MTNHQTDRPADWDQALHFEMPTAREIELDLALSRQSWQSLLDGPTPAAPSNSAGRHAIVVGAGMAGLLAGRVLAESFERVTIVDRDAIPGAARFRDGVPQSRHIHALLKRGLNVLEELYPGFESELVGAGAVALTGRDFLRMSAAGWARRFDGPPLVSASRELIEWEVRCRTLRDARISVLQEQEVHGIVLGDGGAVCGLRVGPRGAQRSKDDATTLSGDLVVDASGRSSKAPEWLESIGYARPRETVINSFLGYATCMFGPPEGFGADWKVLMLGDKPPSMPRGALLVPIEGGRWMVTLVGYGRDYPPTDMAGFMEFARSLRSDILYETIKDARPLSRINGFRNTLNRRRHFESLARMPEGFIVLGDAACAFNPVYGQGMSVAAITALALRQGLREHAQRHGSDMTGFARRMQAEIAKVSQGAWVIATGADVRYPTTEGRTPGFAGRFMQSYLDRVIEVSMQDEAVNDAFLRVVHLLESPASLLRPVVAVRAIAGVRQPIVEPPTRAPQASLRPARA